MVHLTDIAPVEVWDAAFAGRFINRSSHKVLPYDILNYTQATQFAREWNDATLNSRGLVVHRETGEIIARAFSKFFNYGEGAAPALIPGERVVVTDKADGSMGLSYLNPETGVLNIATRGSFNSEQAEHATKRYLELYHGQWEPDLDYTYIWEIVYPENRIVLTYGELDDLILIAKVHTATGRTVTASEIPEWKWMKVEQFDYKTLEEALEAPPRSNAEGLVVFYPESDVRVKIKQSDYVTLHRIITGVSARRIWEALSTGTDMTEWLQNTPEEFSDYIEKTRDDLLTQFHEIRDHAELVYAEIIASLPEGFTQKDFALAVKERQEEVMPSLLFSLHQNIDGVKEDAIAETIWKRLRPEHEKPFWNQSE